MKIFSIWMASVIVISEDDLILFKVALKPSDIFPGAVSQQYVFYLTQPLPSEFHLNYKYS